MTPRVTSSPGMSTSDIDPSAAVSRTWTALTFHVVSPCGSTVTSGDTHTNARVGVGEATGDVAGVLTTGDGVG